MIRVFLAGEGPHELGSWAREPAWREPPRPGVLEALLRAVRPDGWVVVDAQLWKRVPKYRSGDRRSPEQRTVRGLVALAQRAGCQVLVFSRDQDGSRERAAEVEAVLLELAGSEPSIAAGVPVRTLDAWCLAVAGERRTESLADPKAVLEERGVRSTEDRVAWVEQHGLAAVPPDASSLRAFVSRVRAALV